MRQWLISALKTVLAQKLPIAILSLAPILSAVILHLHDVIAPHLSDPTGWLALKAIAVSAALAPLPFVAYFWFRPKLKFDENTGTWVDLKTNLRYCAKCKCADRLSPLKNGIYRWQCPVCDSLFSDPKRPGPVGAVGYGGGPL